ncbi:MAG: phosphotransferase, partial [Desulfobacula sp.]|nr:phosphotransferase [Desulfobacula sp.]
NTHHLHVQIKNFIKKNKYNDIIQTIYEPVILETGGAIANAKPFLKDNPFFVINSDIISNINLKKVYDYHIASDCLASLVLHDNAKFNKIKIDDQNYIQNFDTQINGLAFTGIQVLSPAVFDYFPNKEDKPGKSGKKVFSIIEVYKKLCSSHQVKAFIDKNIFWSDMGTKDSYSITSLLLLAASQFKIDHGKIKEIKIDHLAGDGSDRRWYRAKSHDRSLILSDHGICMPNSDEYLQINAFIQIGRHLASKKLPVPNIYNYDRLSGMVTLEDLGDLHLADLVGKKNHDKSTIKLYKKVIDNLIHFSIEGFKEFKKEWTCQTQSYSKELIIERECRYFIEEFIQNYLNLDFSFNDFSKEFDYIADNAIEHGLIGLMHRDMQSKNIMVVYHDNIYYINFIDFQGARSGPLQYDLASLLIDPYVNLKEPIRDELLQYSMERLKLNRKETQNFLKNYCYCCLTRNMQILGAFSFLSLKKKKKKFEQYIPVAVKNIKTTIMNINMDNKIPKLTKLIQSI